MKGKNQEQVTAITVDDCLTMYKEKEYRKLIQTLDELKTQSDINIIFYKGKAYYALKKYSQAIGCFDKVSSSKDAETDIKQEANYYKGISLYLLKKYDGAIKCFSKVGDEFDLAMCANLYKALSYEEKKLPEYKIAEKYLKKALNLYDNSKYHDKDNIKYIATESLKANLLHQNKFEELLKFWSEHYDRPMGELDKVDLLIDATVLDNTSMVEAFLRSGAKPYMQNKYGISAFSSAAEVGNQKLMKIFLNDSLKKLSQENFEQKKEVSELMEQFRKYHDDNVVDFKQKLGISDIDYEVYQEIVEDYKPIGESNFLVNSELEQ